MLFAIFDMFRWFLTERITILFDLLSFTTAFGFTHAKWRIQGDLFGIVFFLFGFFKHLELGCKVFLWLKFISCNGHLIICNSKVINLKYLTKRNENVPKFQAWFFSPLLCSKSLKIELKNCLSYSKSKACTYQFTLDYQTIKTIAIILGYFGCFFLAICQIKLFNGKGKILLRLSTKLGCLLHFLTDWGNLNLHSTHQAKSRDMQLQHAHIHTWKVKVLSKYPIFGYSQPFFGSQKSSN